MNLGYERRARARVALDVDLFEQARGTEGRVHAKNISSLGICYGGSPFAPRIDGDEVVLRFCLPGDPEPIEVLGTIADERCQARTSETCVAFVWPRESDAQRIRDYVRSRCSVPPRPVRLRTH